ncbi:hypothetical protein KKD19_00620 [Patescibacteria group bacterium]|nr:hypothetical protein [Patescibacteria group bacterium]MBU4511735.1 hypothetical protein [Patescibacteria group bacterium]MCG2692826.1 hypothetical protein [Candidatus Parcubacteria bacterium]
MSFFGSIFGSSLEPRYNHFIKRDEIHSLLPNLLKDKYVFGSTIAKAVITSLEQNSDTAGLVYYGHFGDRIRETELATVVKRLHREGFLKSRFKTENEAKRELLKLVREQDEPRESTEPKRETRETGGSVSETDTLVPRELDRPQVNKKDWRV